VISCRERVPVTGRPADRRHGSGEDQALRFVPVRRWFSNTRDPGVSSCPRRQVLLLKADRSSSCSCTRSSGGPMIYALSLFWQRARRLPMMTDSDRHG
jgi:hypothetical protein